MSKIQAPPNGHFVRFRARRISEKIWVFHVWFIIHGHRHRAHSPFVIGLPLEHPRIYVVRYVIYICVRFVSKKLECTAVIAVRNPYDYGPIGRTL